MGTALVYLVVLLVVAALLFACASAAFGRGEELAPIPKGSTPTWLPDAGVEAMHVRAVRFQQAVRGYRMSEVDWVLDRLAGELDRHAEQTDGLYRRIAELEAAVAGAKQADVVALVTGDAAAAGETVNGVPGAVAHRRAGSAERAEVGSAEAVPPVHSAARDDLTASDVTASGEPR
jgi:DivIVA domain-containing protein